MRGLFGRRRAREPGWLALSVQPDGLSFARAVRGADAKCRITQCGSRTLDDAVKDLERVAKELDAERYQCLTLLSPADYQVLLVEAPNVPPAELKTAVRWRIKDMLDYHVEDATIDVLDIPVAAAGQARGHSMYAVAARNEIIRGCIERLEGARIPLSVIDIHETAQRNIASLYEPANRAVALLYLDKAHALLTVNFQGELYLTRRIDVSIDQLLAPAGGGDEIMNRLLLELQRTFDHLDRQFPFASLAKLVLGPEPRETGLAAYLRRNMDIPVEEVNLGDVLALDEPALLQGEAAWRLFHVVGAALRHESKAL